MKYPWTLKNEAQAECYEYFDKNIRPLPKGSDDKIDPTALGLENNDVDAFRHAYVSGVLTQEYSEKAADILGQLYELSPIDLVSNQISPESRNMDLWNNAVGRKLGLKAKDRKTLLKLVHQALKKKELTTDLKDKRKYKKTSRSTANKSKSVIVLKEDRRGKNKIFYDIEKQKILTLDDFIAAITNGEYPSYSIKKIGGQLAPVSKRDSRKANNLG